MIDPKLNELPVTPLDTGERVESETGTAAPRSRRQGLSITDTIAGDSNLSVGVPGVDTSGVRAGAGAAAGSSSLTPGTGTSPAPELVGGRRGTGENVAGIGHAGRADTGLPGTGTTDAFASEEAFDSDSHISDHAISARAYDNWVARGYPTGSPEVDWETAKQQLRAERSRKTRAATAS